MERGKLLFEDKFANLDNWHREGIVEGISISICRYNDAGRHTGTSNWRRNPGLHLMTGGTDLCQETGRSYHVVITKRGPGCQVEVDERLDSHFTDPQELPGPIPAGGKIGFRAIGSTAIFDIRNFTVAALEDTPPGRS